MNFLFGLFDFASEQNPAEKVLSILSIIFLVAFLLYMILDFCVKTKYVPKHRGLHIVIKIIFLIVFAVLILMKIYYK